MIAGEKVLVVEDDPSLAAMLGDFLHEEGYRTAIASGVRQGRESLAKESYDVLLLDLNLPDGSGLDLFREVQQLPQPPIAILITGYATSDTAIAAVHEGAYDYLTKPLEMKVLKIALERAVGRLLADRRNEALTSLLRILQAINSMDEPNKLLHRIVEIIVAETRSTGGSILVYDEKDDVLKIGATTGLPGDVVRGTSIRPGERVSGWVLEKNEPVLLHGPLSSHPFFRHLDSREDVQSSIIVPLTGRDRRIGVLTLYRDKGQGAPMPAFTGVDLEVFRIFADSVAAAITNGRILSDLKLARAHLENQKRMLSKKNEILTASNRLLSEDNIRREQELKMAADIQQAFLPSHELEVPGLDLAATLVPMHGVAGDFFRYRLLDERRLEIRIGDVSGHGVPAALYMVLTETLFGDERSPSEPLPNVLRRVNDSLLRYFDGAENFVTVFDGVLDLDACRLRYVKAGHNPPILFRYRTREAIPLDAEGVFLGAFPYDGFEEKEIGLEAGDLLLLYTDGLVEATNGTTERFGLDRLIAGTLANLHLTAKGHMKRILDEVREFSGGRRTEDDRTVLLLRLEEDGWVERAIGGSERARSEWVEAVLDEAASHGHPERWRLSLRLALVEALANAVEHGHMGDESRPIMVGWRVRPEKAAVRIADRGSGFVPRIDPESLAARPAGSLRGRGLEMIVGSVDEVSYTRDGTKLTLVKYAGPAEI